MSAILLVLAAVVGLVLLAAAFVYTLDPARVKHWLQRVRAPMVVAITAFLIVELLRSASSLSILIAFFVLSPIAFFLRERRKAKRQTQSTLGGVERTPVLPAVTNRKDENAEKEMES